MPKTWLYVNYYNSLYPNCFYTFLNQGSSHSLLLLNHNCNSSKDIIIFWEARKGKQRIWTRCLEIKKFWKNIFLGCKIIFLVASRPLFTYGTSHFHVLRQKIVKNVPLSITYFNFQSFIYMVLCIHAILHL